MSNRITQKDLDILVSDINAQNGITNAVWNTVGSYRLDYAYGGVKLVKTTSEGGGITNVSPDGYGTKKQLYTFLRGMLA